MAIFAILLGCALAGAIGGAITHRSPSLGHGMAYADFIVIMLTSVAVIVTVLAVIIAILTFIGWQSFAQRVQNEVSRIISEGFQPDGHLHQMFHEQKNKAGVAGVEAIDPEFEAEARAEANKEGEY